MRSARHLIGGVAMALPTLVLSSNDTVWISPNAIPGQELAQATCIVLKGNCASLEQPVYRILARHPHPVTLIYENNPLTIPDFSASTLRQVQGLKFINCPNLDAELSLMSFDKNETLRELTLPVDLRQVPVRELAQFKLLQTLTLVDRYAHTQRPSESLFYLEHGLFSDTPLSINIACDEPLSMAGFRRFCAGLSDQQQTAPAYDPDYKTVKAPIPQLAIPYTASPVNAASSTVLLTDRGSSVQIPENAFVDKNGQPVSGNVMVYFREMQNPMDCILSGIPMTYATGGNHYDFETGGMFDIAATQNDEALTLAPGKSIKVTMPTQNPENFNFYAYNDNQGNWEELGKAPATEKTTVSTGTATVSKAVADYWRMYQNPQYRFHDTTSFADRFTSPLYRYTVFQERPDERVSLRYISKVKGDDKKMVKVTRLIKLGNMHKTKEGDVVFKLYSQRRVHSELNAFNSNIRWKAENCSNLSDFRSLLRNSRRFSDIRLESNGTGYTMYLKKDTSLFSLNVIPFRLDRERHLNEIDSRKNAQMDRHYARALAREEKIFNRSIRARRKDYKGIVIRDSLLRRQFAYHEVYARMTDEEKKMSRADWERYALEQQKYLASNSSVIPDNLYRTFSINGLGIYNCDRVINKPKREYLVKFMNGKNEQVSIRTTYVVNSAINGVITAQPYDSKGCIPITVPSDGKTFLISVGSDNTLNYVPDDLLKESLKGKSKVQVASLTALFLPIDILNKTDFQTLFSY